MLPINAVAGCENHPGHDLTVGTTAPSSTAPTIQREASIEDACAAVRAALSNLWFAASTHGPDGTAAGMRDQSCAPIVRALELWEDWANGTQIPIVGNALPSEANATTTQRFTSAYDDFVTDRTALRSVVDTNLRGSSVLNRCPSDQSDDAVRAAIEQASHTGRYLELAAAVLAPVP